MRASPPISARPATLHRIPSLDGLRAISIILVMGLHSIQRVEITHPVSLIWPVLFNGGLGVSVFFVLSGFLITRLLLHEMQTRGRISVAGFYCKRAFRILPPLYAYIGVLVLLACAGRLALSRIDVLSALFFFHNYALSSHSWAIEHLWSLSVEEQFYLLWPLVLILCLRSSEVLGRRRATLIALAVIVLSPPLRILSFRLHQPLLHNGAGFHMHADLLMFGCCAALLEGRSRFEQAYRSLTRIPWLPFVALALCSYLDMRFQNYWNFPIGDTVLGIVLVVVLLWCVRNADSALGRMLNHPAVTHLGVLSYSIYIWQTLLLHGNNWSVFHGVEWMTRWPVSWIVAFALGETSFFLIERPALRLRNLALRRGRIYDALATPANKPAFVAAAE